MFNIYTWFSVIYLYSYFLFFFCDPFYILYNPIYTLLFVSVVAIFSGLCFWLLSIKFLEYALIAYKKKDIYIYYIIYYLFFSFLFGLMLIYFAFHIIFIIIPVGWKKHTQPNGGPVSNGNGNGNGNGNPHPNFVTLDDDMSARKKRTRKPGFLLSEKDKYRKIYEKARDFVKYYYDLLKHIIT